MERALLLVGEYEERETFWRDQIFRWVRATHHLAGDDVLLQLLNLALKPTELSSLIEHFDALQAVARKELIVPYQVLSDRDNPLVVVYDNLDGKSLQDVLPTDLSAAMPWIIGAGDALHALHQQRIIHGNITLDAFLVRENRVYLQHFGYSPLIALGHTIALNICRDHLAPEVTTEKQVTAAMDIYAFAVMLAKVFPQLSTLSWFQLGTESNLSKRFSRIRTAISELEKAQCKVPQQEKPVILYDPPSLEGGLVRKYNISVHPEPEDAGTVTGGGRFAEGSCVTLTAEAKESWRFAGWRGDLSGTENPLKFEITGPCRIVAVFEEVKDRVILCTVQATVSPNDAGAVEGDGVFKPGETVSLRAVPKKGWRFDRWLGDFSGTVNPALLTTRCDMNILASFVISEVSLSIKCKPTDAGRIQGAGTYKPGETVTVKAHPQPGWEFERWSGDLQGTSNLLTLMLNSSKNLVANFRRGAASDQQQQFQVTLSVDPPGSGGVSGAGSYTKGEIIKLQAYSSDPLGWQFDHWSGKVGGSRNPLEMQVNDNIEVVAHFKRSGWRREVIAFADPPVGGEIDGGGQFPRGQRITLTANPKPGWRFTHWSEGLSGIDNTVSLVVDDTTTVIAHFERKDVETSNTLGTAFGDRTTGRELKESERAIPESGVQHPGGLGRAFNNPNKR
ncbi:MAG: InlB B-repeat-containing protein [Armatimonadota bacterium]